MNEDQIIPGSCFVTGDDVTADDILPVEYLTFDVDDPDERKFFGAYALSGVEDRFGRFVPAGSFKSEWSIVIAGRGFGAGSARMQAPLALAEAGVRAVVAESFGDGFYRAAINGGHLLPIIAPAKTAKVIRTELKTGDQLRVDLDRSILILETGAEHPIEPLGVARAMVARGGLLEGASGS